MYNATRRLLYDATMVGIIFVTGALAVYQAPPVLVLFLSSLVIFLAFERYNIMLLWIRWELRQEAGKRRKR